MKWHRVVAGSLKSLDGVARCENCTHRTDEAYTDGDVILCAECLGDAIPCEGGDAEMVGKETSYEESLETMNEERLRRECIHLHEQLMIATKKLLTQPVPNGRSKEEVQAQLEEIIEEKRREYHDDSDTYVLETEFP